MAATDCDYIIVDFELVLANGKSLSTNAGEELANFLDSRGESIVPVPQRKGKKNRKNRKGRKPAKAT